MLKKDPVDYDRLALHRVVLSYAVCNVYTDGDRVVEVAPILHRLARSVGMSWQRLSAAIRHQRHGTVHTLYSPPPILP